MCPFKYTSKSIYTLDFTEASSRSRQYIDNRQHVQLRETYRQSSYGLKLSGRMGVEASISLARLTYSQGNPRLSTLNSRPICGQLSVSGLCKLVKLVSRHSLRRLDGVGPSLQWCWLRIVRPFRSGRRGEEHASSARISGSTSMSRKSRWRSSVTVTRQSDTDADTRPDTTRWGLAGPRVVTTWEWIRVCDFVITW